MKRSLQIDFASARERSDCGRKKTVLFSFMLPLFKPCESHSVIRALHHVLLQLVHTHKRTHTYSSSSPFILLLLPPNSIIYHTSCKTKHKTDDKESECSVCVLFLSELQRHNVELCVCVCVSQVPTPVSPLGCLVWPVSDRSRINTSVHIDSIAFVSKPRRLSALSFSVLIIFILKNHFIMQGC